MTTWTDPTDEPWRLPWRRRRQAPAPYEQASHVIIVPARPAAVVPADAPRELGRAHARRMITEGRP